MNITVIIVALVFIGLIFITTLITGVPPQPSSKVVLKTIISILPKKLKGGEQFKVIELGSGWGGVANALARHYPKKKVVGLEVSFIPWLFSNLRLFCQPQPNLSFHFQNFFKTDLSETSLIVCYLVPDTMERLREKFNLELPDGSLIVSNTFALNDWVPSKVLRADDVYRSPVYLYKMPQLNL